MGYVPIRRKNQGWLRKMKKIIIKVEIEKWSLTFSKNLILFVSTINILYYRLLRY